MNITKTQPSKQFLDLLESYELTQEQFSRLMDRFNVSSSPISYGTTASSSGSNNIIFYQTVEPTEAPPANPEQFIEQQKQRIAQQQKTQRKDRIKPWDDKAKRFK